MRTLGLVRDLLGCLMAAFVAVGCTQLAEPVEATNRLLVKPRPGISMQQLDAILARHRVRRVDAISQINVHVVEAPRSADAGAIARKLAEHPDIEFAEVDRHVPPSRRPSTTAPR